MTLHIGIFYIWPQDERVTSMATGWSLYIPLSMWQVQEFVRCGWTWVEVFRYYEVPASYKVPLMEDLRGQHWDSKSVLKSLKDVPSEGTSVYELSEPLRWQPSAPYRSKIITLKTPRPGDRPPLASPTNLLIMVSLILSQELSLVPSDTR